MSCVSRFALINTLSSLFLFPSSSSSSSSSSFAFSLFPLFLKWRALCLQLGFFFFLFFFSLSSSSLLLIAESPAPLFRLLRLLQEALTVNLSRTKTDVLSVSIFIDSSRAFVLFQSHPKWIPISMGLIPDMASTRERCLLVQTHFTTDQTTNQSIPFCFFLNPRYHITLLCLSRQNPIFFPPSFFLSWFLSLQFISIALFLSSFLGFIHTKANPSSSSWK